MEFNRDELKKEAEALGIEYKNNISSKNLHALIERTKAEQTEAPPTANDDIEETEEEQKKEENIFQPLHILKSFYSSELNRAFYAGHFIPKNKEEYDAVKDKSILVTDYNKGIREVKVDKVYKEQNAKTPAPVDALNEQLNLEIEVV